MFGMTQKAVFLIIQRIETEVIFPYTLNSTTKTLFDKLSIPWMNKKDFHKFSLQFL